MIESNWIADLPMTAAGFEMIQNHVDLLSSKVHAVLTRTTATATDAAEIIRDMCLRSGAWFPDVLVMDHDAKFTSEVFLRRLGVWDKQLLFAEFAIINAASTLSCEAV